MIISHDTVASSTKKLLISTPNTILRDILHSLTQSQHKKTTIRVTGALQHVSRSARTGVDARIEQKGIKEYRFVGDKGRWHTMLEERGVFLPSRDLHLPVERSPRPGGIESSVNVKFKRRSASGGSRGGDQRRDRYPNTLKQVRNAVHGIVEAWWRVFGGR